MGLAWEAMGLDRAEHDKRIARRERIWIGLEGLPLSCFTVGEYQILRRFIENKGCTKEDLSCLEKKIEKSAEGLT